MNEMNRVTTFLPGFGGFHGTAWEDLLRYAREMHADRLALEERDQGLDAATISAILRETCDDTKFFRALAERFCRRFDAATSPRLGFELGLTFQALDGWTLPGSTTDHILATMPVRSARKLFEASAREDHRRFVEAMRERLDPYDGFSCHHDTVWQWLEQPVENWGRAALCDLLAVFVDPDIDYALYAEMAEKGDMHMAFEEALDQGRFAQLAAQRRHTPPTSSTIPDNAKRRPRERNTT